MRAFKSLFLGKSDEDIHIWIIVHKHYNFSQLTFTILDEDIIKNKTCRVGYLPDDDRMIVADFYANIYMRFPIEVVTMSWHEVELIGTEKKNIDGVYFILKTKLLLDHAAN